MKKIEREHPYFSVITVCLNERNKIRATCESICGQSFHDFEWIVVDGSSTDGTLDILAEYKDRINVMVTEPDRGIYHAMNKGIRLASGQYLVFMNGGGDRFMDEEVLKTVAVAPKAGILYGDILLKEADGLFLRYPDELPSDYLLNNMLPHQASFIWWELFEQYGHYDETFKIAGDYDLFVRLLDVHRVSCFHVPKTLAVFDGDGISTNSKNRSLRKNENHIIRKKYFPQYCYSLKRVRQDIRNWFSSKRFGMDIT